MPEIQETNRDLPPDTLRLILKLGQFSFEDQNSFRAVCRSWRSFVGGVKPRFQLPWLLVYSASAAGRYFAHNSYFLCNPSTGKAYHLDVPFSNMCPLHPTQPGSRSFGPKILAVNSGWLLATHLFNCCMEAPFLFNPFTRRTVQLPAQTILPCLGNRTQLKYAFQYCPVEASFTVYAAWFMPGVLVVSSWRSGEKEWETHKVTRVHGWGRRRAEEFGMVCDGKGKLYCCFFTEKLVVLSPRVGREGFDCVELPLPHSYFDGVFGVSEGDLYAVSIDDRRQHFFRTLDYIRALRLDLAGRAWVAEENDGKAYYFHRENEISTVVVSEPASECAGHAYQACGTINVSCSSQPFPAQTNASRGALLRDYLWSFQWPQEVLAFYSPEQLSGLHTIWIEPPTF